MSHICWLHIKVNRTIHNAPPTDCSVRFSRHEAALQKYVCRSSALISKPGATVVKTAWGRTNERNQTHERTNHLLHLCNDANIRRHPKDDGFLLRFFFLLESCQGFSSPWSSPACSLGIQIYIWISPSLLCDNVENCTEWNRIQR